MNSGATADRVYDALKRQLLSGSIAPGQKLEPAAIANHLSSSVTPVRDALHRLIGERLVETRSGEGFYLPYVREAGLRDLYAWHGEILALILRAPVRPARPIPPLAPDGALLDETEAVFTHIAMMSDNGEHARSLDATGDRLRIARLAETSLFPDREVELDEIRNIADAANLPELRKAILRYHRRRIRFSAEIARLIYREIEERDRLHQ